MKESSNQNKNDEPEYEQFETDKPKKSKNSLFTKQNLIICCLCLTIFFLLLYICNLKFSLFSSKPKKKRVVIALGGNALGKNLEEQRRDVKVSAKAIADLLEENCEVLVVHGNGPQVGLINNAFNEYYNNHKNDGGFPVPLSMAGAMSEAYIGYDLQNALQEEFLNRNLKVNNNSN